MSRASSCAKRTGRPERGPAERGGLAAVERVGHAVAVVVTGVVARPGERRQDDEHRMVLGGGHGERHRRGGRAAHGHRHEAGAGRADRGAQAQREPVGLPVLQHPPRAGAPHAPAVRPGAGVDEEREPAAGRVRAQRRLHGHAAHGHADPRRAGGVRSRGVPREIADADLEPVDAGRRGAAAGPPVPRDGVRDGPQPGTDRDLARPREIGCGRSPARTAASSSRRTSP